MGNQPARPMPATAQAMRNQMGASVDYSGMDPQMASTMGQEMGRTLKAKAMYAPTTLAGQSAKSPAPPHKPSLLDSIVRKIWGK